MHRKLIASLLFLLCGTVAHAQSFAGAWGYHTKAYDFLLTLRQRGDRLTGHHSIVARGGARIDTVEVEEPVRTSIQGKVAGRTATVRFESGYGEDAGGTARLNLEGERLRWERLSSKGEHYFPERAVLTREGSGGGDSEIMPGQSIGKIALGEARTEALKRLGKPNESHRWKNGMQEDHWLALGGRKRTDNYPPDLTVLSRKGKVVQVAVSSPRFKLGDGTSTATTLGAIRKKYPALKVSEYVFEDYFGLYFDDVKQGLAFFIGGQDDIMPQYKPERIIVHKAGSRVIPDENGKRTKVTSDKTKG